MAGVIIIAVLFTGISAAIFWAAPRGRLDGLTNAMLSETPAARRVINGVLVLVYVGFGVVIPAIFLVNNHAQAKTNVAGIRLTSAEVSGQTIFGEHCAVCHTLAAANAVGKVGPNLDQIRPSVALIEYTLAHGCTQTSSSCLGYGQMPADIVQGTDARDVAMYVARVAGHP
jgi:mono/diheme cytochrome c family protein